jgi:hypothetical protein
VVSSVRYYEEAVRVRTQTGRLVARLKVARHLANEKDIASTPPATTQIPRCSLLQDLRRVFWQSRSRHGN